MNKSELICTRRNQLYVDQKEKWEKALKAYSGGKEYVENTLIQHSAECTLEFKERKARCHYFNYPKRVVDTIVSYVMGTSPKRGNVNIEIEENFNRIGNRANEVMRQVNMYLDIFGLCWILVDNPNTESEITLEQKTKWGIRPYAVVLNPLNVTDWDFNESGKLNWVIVKENSIESSDPFSEASSVESYTLWTDKTWERFTKSEDEITSVIGNHNIGEVPIQIATSVGGYGTSSNHWFNDAISVSDSIMNAESEAQINTIKQIFGLAVFPDTFIDRASKSSQKLIDNGTSELDAFAITLARTTAVTETADEKGICRYIAPPAYVVSVIREEIKELKKELYDVIGIGVKSNAKNAESAESKAWDYISIGNAMKTRADLLEQVEIKIWELMNKWDSSVNIPNVAYNRDFELRALSDNVQSLLDLQLVNDSEEFVRETKVAAVSLLDDIQKLPQERYNELTKEAKGSTKKEVEVEVKPQVVDEKP